MSSETMLIIGWSPVNVVDHQRFDRQFAGFELQAELFLQGAIDGRAAGVGSVPVQGEVEGAFEARFYRPRGGR